MLHFPIAQRGLGCIPASGFRRLHTAIVGLAVLAAVCATNPALARGAPESFADLAAKLSPAVVNVSTTQKVADRRGLENQMPQFPPGSPFEDFFKDFFDRQQKNGNRPPRPVTSLGSGFVIDPSGVIVTNNHVIADADEIKVIFSDGTEVPAKLIGTDPKTDVAVLRVDVKHPLVAVNWGDSDKARVGDWVLAIGNPFGLGGTVTAGIVSARGRDIRSGPYDDFIQTDAAINKGNSGGPLFNVSGEVVGINTAIFSQSGGSIGIGFAVPAALARPVVEQLVQSGHIKRGWLGVNIQTVTEEIAEALGLDKPHGALVAGVSDGGPAEQGKVQVGDVILTFDGKPVPDMRQLPRLVADTPIGKQVAVEVWRKGKAQKLKVTIGELKEQEEVATAQPEPEKSGAAAGSTAIEQFGMSLSSITPELRQRFELKPDVKGVVVTEVNPSGVAAARDVAPGDVIVEFEQSEVESPAQVKEKLNELQKTPRKVALVILQRAGNQRIIALPVKK